MFLTYCVTGNSIKNRKNLGASVTLGQHGDENLLRHNEEERVENCWWLVYSLAQDLRVNVSERIAPGFVLFGADLTVLAQIISKVIPILSGIDCVTFYNTLMHIAEEIECLLFGHGFGVGVLVIRVRFLPPMNLI